MRRGRDHAAAQEYSAQAKAQQSQSSRDQSSLRPTEENSMYRNLHHDIILTPPQDIPARPTPAHNDEDIQVTAARHHPRIRRLAAIAASGVCVAATTVMTIGGASANPRPETRGNHISAQRLQQEMRTLRAEGFVATSCTVGGTLMTNYSTNQSILVKQ
jgi:hypothetical protein